MSVNTPYAGVASLFVSRLRSGLAPHVFEDGRQLRDFVHVVDVARATKLALTTAPDATGPINVASGVPCTIGQVAETLADAWTDGLLRPIVTDSYRLGDVRHIVASAAKAKEVLGFAAEINLRDGIGALVRETRSA